MEIEKERLGSTLNLLCSKMEVAKEFAVTKEIYKDMISIFKKNNIEPIKSINEKLDPNLHQAMMEIEDNSKDAGTIVQEIQKGFIMKDRLLRPSLVGVSKKTSINGDKKEEKDKKNEQNQEKTKKN